MIHILMVLLEIAKLSTQVSIQVTACKEEFLGHIANKVEHATRWAHPTGKGRYR